MIDLMVEFIPPLEFDGIKDCLIMEPKMIDTKTLDEKESIFGADNVSDVYPLKDMVNIFNEAKAAGCTRLGVDHDGMIILFNETKTIAWELWGRPHDGNLNQPKLFDRIVVQKTIIEGETK